MVKNYNFHKNKLRTNEPKTWKNNKNTEVQAKWSGSYKKKCKVSTVSATKKQLCFISVIGLMGHNLRISNCQLKVYEFFW